ncbi:FAD-dependent monooxygenase [Actinoallomurus sp. NPDC050550]
MRTQDVPVLVVGGGPVGLSTGLFLAHWGVRLRSRSPAKTASRT